ncbi:hypothetical protein WN55_01029 [Dufourea novaeangliae]|uniref:Uncharacterized protein n=1 Tax=Dufourea novaeangliae TaxID=178035 RepID=A0A154PDQ6_DUFNO|nr:hypothetical protein WN55_01029 [Dufourea novaeangliae]
MVAITLRGKERQRTRGILNESGHFKAAFYLNSSGTLNSVALRKGKGKMVWESNKAGMDYIGQRITRTNTSGVAISALQ